VFHSAFTGDLGNGALTCVEDIGKQAVPFFMGENMENSLRFYVDGLGFAITKKWIDEGKLRWCWLEHGDAALRLPESHKEGEHSWRPNGKVGDAASICFICGECLR
jgi:lactoylglutathione lyase